MSQTVKTSLACALQPAGSKYAPLVAVLTSRNGIILARACVLTSGLGVVATAIVMAWRLA